MKCLRKSLDQIQCAKVPQCFSWNQGFFTCFVYFCLFDCCPVPTLSYAAKTISPTPSKVLWTNDRSNIRPQTSKHYWSDSSKFILPNAHTLKIWL